ncbi:MAG: nuclear transport factor 2 family protein [Steroidobacteraceae bacterium]
MRSVKRNFLAALLGVISLSVIGMPARAQTPQLEANKKVAQAFYDAAINRKNFEDAVKYLGAQYKQHNPTAADGAEGLKGFIEFLKMRFPNQRGEIKHVIAEGDLVVLHVHSTRGDGTPGRAIVDIFRLQNGKIVEHWDVIQDIPEKASNSNGMF